MNLDETTPESPTTTSKGSALNEGRSYPRAQLLFGPSIPFGRLLSLSERSNRTGIALPDTRLPSVAGWAAGSIC